MTQADVAKEIGNTQTFVSKCERGQRRVDIIELRGVCKALGIDITSFLTRLDVEKK